MKRLSKIRISLFLLGALFFCVHPTFGGVSAFSHSCNVSYFYASFAQKGVEKNIVSTDTRSVIVLGQSDRTNNIPFEMPELKESDVRSVSDKSDFPKEISFIFNSFFNVNGVRSCSVFDYRHSAVQTFKTDPLYLLFCKFKIP